MKLQPKPRMGVEGLQHPEIDSTAGLIKLCEENITSDMIGAEIGSYAGVSTEVFANFAKKIFAIDPWERAVTIGDYKELSMQQLLEAKQRFNSINNQYDQKIIAVPLFSAEAIMEILFLLDFVYLDGAHDRDNVLIDVLLWKKKIKLGGFLSGHDYYLVKAHLNLLGLEADKVYEDTSWIIRV
jgi:hypothetical protein